MPTYEIQAPDGNRYRIDGPAGATDEQIRAEVVRQNPHLGSPRQQWRQVRGMDAAATQPMQSGETPNYAKAFESPGLGRSLLGLGENTLSSATGIASGLGGGLAYLGTLGASLDPDAAEAVRQQVGTAFTYRPRTEAGKAQAEKSAMILGAPAKFARYIGEKNQEQGGSALGSTALEVGINAIPMAIGGRRAGEAGNSAIGGLVNRVAEYRPGFKRTPEAQRLIDQGVDLTPGQMNPGGTMSAMEQLPIKAHIPVIGGVMADARSNARQSWQRSIAEEAAAPGTKIKSTDVNAMVDEAYQSFGPMYEQAKGFPVSPVILKTGDNGQLIVAQTVPLKKAFANAVTDKGIQADPATRASTGAWLMNKYGALQRKPGASSIDSAQLIELRSDIRAQIRKNSRANDAAKNDSAELLRNAEKAITDALESQLPPEPLSALRAADAKYGDYKVFEAAVAKAKDNPSGFSPENLAQAIKESTESGAYARGGGRMRQNAKDAKASLADGVPATGAIAPALFAGGSVATGHPWLAAPVIGGSMLLSGTKSGRRFARGETAAQQWAKSVTEALSKQR